MKINDSNIPGLGPNGVGNTGGVGEGLQQPKGAGQASNSVDQVSLSGLSAAISAAQSDSPDRAAYLERLSADVEAGRYKVDAGALAKDIVQDAMKPDIEE